MLNAINKPKQTDRVYGFLRRTRMKPTRLLEFRVLKHRHFHRHAGLFNLIFEIDPDLRIFILVFDEGAAFAKACAHAFLIDRFPDAEKIFSRLAAVAKRQLARFLFSSVEMLVEPTRRGAEDAPLAPVHSHNLVTVTRLIR